MNGRPRPLLRLLRTSALALAVPACAAVLPSAAALAAESPLPASNYATRPACPSPSRLHASCLAVQLLPLSARARELSQPIGIVRSSAGASPAAHDPAAGDFGLRPADLRTAYDLPETAAGEQTVALIDAYNDPTAEADLASYSSEFGLPACTTGNGCFKKVGQSGSEAALPFPKTGAELEAAEAGPTAGKEEAEAAVGWGAEISLDIETTHAVCPGCHILLVEASTTSYADLEQAEQTAETLGATELSNSWGGPEQGVTVSEDTNGPFNDPGVVITASAGDSGFLGWDSEFEDEAGFANYPASSPHVVAVGGTHLSLGSGSAWSSETVWNGSGASGGGCSVVFTAPLWQQNVADWSAIGCADKRVVADVSADADPYTGIAVTDSSSACETEYSEGGTKHVIHWCTYGGTSLASPIIASVFALAGGADGAAYPARTLYENERLAPGTLHDVTVGSNGECGAGYNAKTGLSSCEPSVEAAASCNSKGSCLAGTGFDGPSGVGTPHGIGAFEPGEDAGEEESAPKETPAEEKSPEEKTREKVEEKADPKEGSNDYPTPAPPSSAPHPSPTPVATRAASTPAVSALGLTIRALVRLDSRRPSASKVAFFYLLTAPARVGFTLARQVLVHHRHRWITVGPAAGAAAVAGRNAGQLRGGGSLSPGLYRLTVTPQGGRAKAIYFHID
jgi:hypothetical protein